MNAQTVRPHTPDLDTNGNRKYVPMTHYKATRRPVTVRIGYVRTKYGKYSPKVRPHGSKQSLWSAYFIDNNDEYLANAALIERGYEQEMIANQGKKYVRKLKNHMAAMARLNEEQTA